MPAEMTDEGVHEIQLNGKQLVFMFMAVTVVAVVIFLCGVMVGRGVRAPLAIEQADAAIESPVDPTATGQMPAPPAADAAPLVTPASQEKLTYADRLSTTTPPPETLKEPVIQEVKAAAAVRTPAAEPPPIAPAVRTSKPAATQSAAGGYVVQVTAVKERSEAELIAKRLASKGFKSFVTSPGAGAAKVYRVRVGKYNDRREAEAVARRLEKEEQFKPWITR
jgi:cell division protein FtsN